MTDQLDYQVTVEELSALMKRTAGVHVDPVTLRQQADDGFDTFGLDSSACWASWPSWRSGTGWACRSRPSAARRPRISSRWSTAP